MLQADHQKQNRYWIKVDQELNFFKELNVQVDATLTWTTLRILERSTSAMMPIFVTKALQTILKG